MQSNAGMANRHGDVDLRKAQVSAPPLTLWLGMATRFIHSERSNCPQHIEKEAQQDNNPTGDTMPDCPATMPCGPDTLLLIRAYSKQPSASNNTGHKLLRFTMALRSSPAMHQAVHHHSRLTGRFSTTSHHRDVDQADQSLPIRQEVFHTTRPAADQTYIMTIKSSPDCTFNS